LFWIFVILWRYARLPTQSIGRQQTCGSLPTVRLAAVEASGQLLVIRENRASGLARMAGKFRKSCWGQSKTNREAQSLLEKSANKQPGWPNTGRAEEQQEQPPRWQQALSERWITSKYGDGLVMRRTYRYKTFTVQVDTQSVDGIADGTELSAPAGYLAVVKIRHGNMPMTSEPLRVDRDGGWLFGTEAEALMRGYGEAQMLIDHW
jgi:hypothetical protein